MNIKNLYFKVKKIELKEGGSRIGVLVPLLNDNSNTWFNPSVSFDDKKLKAILSDGTTMIVSANSNAIKTTRITDENIKKIIEEIVETAKKNYKVEAEFEKSFNDYIKKTKEFKEMQKNIEGSLIDSTKKLAKASGFVDGAEFLKVLNTKIKGASNGYSITLDTVGAIVKGFKLEKIYELGRWLDESSYDFIYVEYDDNVCILENLEKSKDFNDIKRKNFSDIKDCNVNGATLKSIYGAEGGGDKRSACAYHTIKVTFPKSLEKTSENISKIADTINATLKLL